MERQNEVCARIALFTLHNEKKRNKNMTYTGAILSVHTQSAIARTRLLLLRSRFDANVRSGVHFASSNHFRATNTFGELMSRCHILPLQSPGPNWVSFDEWFMSVLSFIVRVDYSSCFRSSFIPTRLRSPIAELESSFRQLLTTLSTCSLSVELDLSKLH